MKAVKRFNPEVGVRLVSFAVHWIKACLLYTSKSGLWTAVTVCGMMAGIWIFGRLADKIGRKPSFLSLIHI